MEITINGSLPTLNQYIDTERTNKFLAAKMKREATEQVAWQVKGLPKIDHPARYIFTWYVKNKKSDPDNIVFAKKFILDGLVVAGILPNDTFRYVVELADKFIVSKEEKIVVTVELTLP